MSLKTNSPENYILGTDPAELERLGYQHRIWSSEADELWKKAGFTRGDTILDLGCGPGFCTVELSQLVGSKGKVIASDKSPVYLEYLLKKQPHLENVETVLGDFLELNVEEGSLDGIYCRWALAWVENPEAVIKKVSKYLKPGGVWAAQEYLNWGTFKVYPENQIITKVIEAARKGWREMEGNIDIGSLLPELFENSGLKVESIEPMIKIGRGGDQVWHWPGTFYDIYTFRLIELGLLSNKDREEFLQAWSEVEKSNHGYVVCPSMVSILGRK